MRAQEGLGKRLRVKHGHRYITELTFYVAAVLLTRLSRCTRIDAQNK